MVDQKETFGVTEFVNRTLKYNPEKNLVFQDIFESSIEILENAGMVAFVNPEDKTSEEVKFTEEDWMRMGTNFMLHKMTGL